MSEEMADINSDGGEPQQLNPVEIERAVHQIDPKAFKNIPKPQRLKIISQVASITLTQKTHIGPIPDPDSLQRYNEIIPNGAERIMTMAEKQQDHRMELEKLALKRQLNQSGAGQILAFLIGIFALTIAGILGYYDKQIIGSILGSGGLIGLVTAFIQGKKQQSNSLIKKRPQ